MNVTLEDKDFDTIKEMAMDQLASNIADKIWTPYGHGDIQDWDKRDKENTKARQKILDAIDWKNAPQYISETVVRKFFHTMLENR
jgi:hypothetical protein